MTPHNKTTHLMLGRRYGKSLMVRDAVKAAMAQGKTVAIATRDGVHKVVGVVDDPDTRLIEGNITDAE